MTEQQFLNSIPPLCANSIQSERDYQEKMWNKNTTSSGGMHSESEFLVFMQDYLHEAMHIVSRNPEPMASETAAHNVRKICAMALACAEKNDWVDKFSDYTKYNKVNTNTNIVQGLALMQHCINKALEGVFTESTESVRLHLALVFMAGTQSMVNTELCPLRE